MTLVGYENQGGEARFGYTVTHSTPGRDGTTLSAGLQLYVRHDKSWCELEVDNCEGANQKEALDRMVLWLRRLADGIEQRREVLIPL